MDSVLDVVADVLLAESNHVALVQRDQAIPASAAYALDRSLTHSSPIRPGRQGDQNRDQAIADPQSPDGSNPASQAVVSTSGN